MERLHGAESADRKRAIQILAEGGLVGIPTETVYGLAADARNIDTVRRIFSVKGRPLLDPLIVHCDSLQTVETFCEVSDPARQLAELFWPGPLTLILPRTKRCPIPGIVSAGRETLAVRLPAHPVTRELLTESRIPLAAPSANPFGYISPTRAEHVIDSLGDRIEAVLDGGPCAHGLESTIVSVSRSGDARLLRAGPISSEQIRETVRLIPGSSAPEHSGPEAPGMLPSHYRPGKGVVLFAEGKEPRDSDETKAIVSLRRPIEPATSPNRFWLSEDGNPAEIAHNLFELLRNLDKDPSFTGIYVELPSSSDGILRAVRDRLARASVPPDS